MVYVTHDGDDGCARDEVVLVVFFFADGLLHLCADVFRLESELIGYEVDGFGIESLVDADHDADRHQGGDDLCDADVHHRCQFADGDELGELQGLALCCLLGHLFVETFLYGFTLFLTVFGTLLVLALFVGESCQGLLDLACDVLLVHL